MAQSTPSLPDPQSFVTTGRRIVQSHGAVESVMTCIVETHRSSLSRNENLNLLYISSLTVAKQGCVNKQNVYSGSVAFTGGSDTFIEEGSSLK